MQLWTNPVVVTTSFSRISAIASSAEMTLFFLMEPVILPGTSGSGRP